MNFDGSFRRVGSANVAVATAFVSKLSEESWRQDTNEAQALSGGDASQLIYLVHDDLLRHDQPTKQPALEVFATAIRPILAIAADHFDSSQEGQQLIEKNGAGYFVRARLLRVSAGATFAAAKDVVFSETHAHRIHIPIVTNQSVVFTVGEESLTIPDGEIFEINNRYERMIDNRGEGACVHLVLDYVLKGEMCCCGIRQHPKESCSQEACYASDRATSPCSCFAGSDH